MAAEPFELPVRVYWADTDAGGVVYHSNYLDYCERARTEWLRQLGFSQHRMADEEGVLFTVAALQIDFRRPAKLDDLLSVRTHATLGGGATVEFMQEVWRIEPTQDLLATAQVRVACVDAASFKPRRVPGSIRERFA
jgi:tol-pal system-associated acyl-CoA thioesterase